MYNKNIHITAFLFVVFGLSTWLDIIGVGVELPLIINHVPEGWALPSYLGLAVSISTMAPVVIILLKLIFKQHLDERIFIYIEIIIGIISCGLLGQYWNKTSWLFGAQHSVLLFFFVFLLGTLGSTSTITYYDYMKRYNTKLLDALLFGENLASFIPVILAVIQWKGGEPICLLNSANIEYSKPRFPVHVYFWILTFIVLLSFVAFLTLEWTKIADSYRIKDYKSSNTYELNSPTDKSSLIESEPSFEPMSTKLYHSLLAVAYYSYVFLHGILPAIVTYAMLPYSHTAFYISRIILPIAGPLSIIINRTCKSRLALASITILCFIATCTSVYVVTIAALSPCPPLHDTVFGAIIAIACFFISQLLYNYVRAVIANRIRQEYKHNSGLFWLGAVFRMGSMSGEILMFFLINTFHFFKSREACRSYC
ncbi:unnamed protein product [Rotaria sp. Silwood2]|nr:unnamed protein product [Rotaria sp. Silwood2]CAF2798464.1 unnamed protein product [Rotaria sp. Silwood2]CAF3222916.1 unnamed protein product [Rotaria sp. Silwood2]CAF4440623.1 unnamed protein product [Rotaria sp. Silwood2]CAF4567650.1 unnamed protein product [Rotaria sp. Silwood2]